MSRAFVKELDGVETDADLLERPQSSHPNYITLEGLERLKARVQELRERQLALEAQKEDLSAGSELRALKSELRYLEQREQKAIPIDPAAQSADAIRFGATVQLEDAGGQRHTFTIVGEDEADVERGLISWVSPLGRELLDKRAGDVVNWRRPAGDLDLEILDFRYGKAA
ncbi:MAG: GreA/GreB family elongation factor [Gammaproteobacteria bacterium]|nr:GreA/GreB family elongation factor [Gammaproteobacteria bacterium]